MPSMKNLLSGEQPKCVSKCSSVPNETELDPEPEEEKVALLQLEMCNFTRTDSRKQLHAQEHHREERLTCYDRLCAAAEDIIVLLAAAVWLIAGLIMASGPVVVIRDRVSYESATLLYADCKDDTCPVYLDGTGVSDVRFFLVCLSAVFFVVSFLVCICGACCEERETFDRAESSTETTMTPRRRTIQIKTLMIATGKELGPLKRFLIMYSFVTLLMSGFLMFLWSHEEFYDANFRLTMENVTRAVNRICMDTEMAKVKLGCPDWSGPGIPGGLATIKAPSAHVDSSIIPGLRTLLNFRAEGSAQLPPERALLKELGDDGCPLIPPLCIPPDDFNISTACVCRGAQYHKYQTEKWEGTYCFKWNNTDMEWCYVESSVPCGSTTDHWNISAELKGNVSTGNMTSPSKVSHGPCTSAVESRSKLIPNLLMNTIQKLHILFVVVCISGIVLLTGSLCSCCWAGWIQAKELLDDPYDRLHETK